ASSINLSIQTLATDSTQFIYSGSLALSMTMQSLYDKCLFLHVRHSLRKVFENLVWQIIKYDLNSADDIEWLQTATKHFGDFRNKLINKIEIPITSSLQKEVVAFIDEFTIIQ
ncbi:15863_t:CDS:2, partial [Racocetra persica]